MEEKIISREEAVNDLLDRCNDIWAECELLEKKQQEQLDKLAELQ